jgi:drug/metabolite transporter (DMT)-like permease
MYQNNFSFGNIITGDLLIILSGLLYAIDVTLCKYLGERFDVKKTVQVISFTCAAITISIIVLFQIPMNVELSQIPNILVMSLIGTGMSTAFFLMGLKLIGAVRTIMLYSTTSVFGILFSGLILSEVITPVDIFSTGLVLAGIFLLRNKLAGTEKGVEIERVIETEIANKTNTMSMILAKKSKILSRLTMPENTSKEKIKNTIFPNYEMVNA